MIDWDLPNRSQTQRREFGGVRDEPSEAVRCIVEVQRLLSS